MAKPPPPPLKKVSNTNGKGATPPPVAVVHNLKKPQSGDSKPLNFKVDPEFHREFKAYAASHGISMVELLREGFVLIKEHRGGQ
jgi:HicB family